MRHRPDNGTVSMRPRIPDGPIDWPPDWWPIPEEDDDDGGASDEPPESGTDTPSAQRRYVITADRFHCGDESASDWWGSDEVVWSFTTKLDDEETHTYTSREFGDVDSGETRYFRTGRGEIAPSEGSLDESVGAPVGVSIQLVESDWGDDLEDIVKQAFEAAEHIPKVGEWVSKVPEFVRNYIVDVLEDDLMGSNTIVFRSRDLERRLPTIGSSFTDRFYFGGQGGDLPFEVAGGPDYYLYVQVVRVEDAT